MDDLITLIIMFSIAALAFAVPAYIAFHKDRRSMLCSFLIIATTVVIAIGLIAVYARLQEMFGKDWIAVKALKPFLAIALFLIVLFPFVSILNTFITGLITLIKGGFKSDNFFAVLFSLVMITYTFVWPLVKGIHVTSLSLQIYTYLTIMFAYTIMLKTALLIHSELNLLHFKKDQGIEYIAVLGQPRNWEEPLYVIERRIDKAADVYRNNPGSKVVLANGWNDGRITCSEMADYAKEAGIAEDDILLEEASSDTAGMIVYSYEKIKKDSGKESPKFALVSTRYHVVRALMIARRQKIDCTGYGSKASYYYSTNAFIREYIEFLRLTSKFQKRLLLVYTCIYWLSCFTMINYGIGINFGG